MDNLREKFRKSSGDPLTTFAGELQTGRSEIEKIVKEDGVLLSSTQEKELGYWVRWVDNAQKAEEAAAERVQARYEKATAALIDDAFINADRILRDLERNDALLATKLQIDLEQLRDRLNGAWQQRLVELWTSLKETRSPLVLKQLESFLADNWGYDQHIPDHVEISRRLLADAEGGVNLNLDNEAILIWNEVVTLTKAPELSSFIGETLQTKPQTIRDSMASILVADNPDLVRAMILMAFYDSHEMYREYIDITLVGDVARLIARLKKERAAQ